MINVLVWNEFHHEKTNEEVKNVYPEGIHTVIKSFLATEDKLNVTTATVDEPECGLTQARLDATDVILWWGHARHDDVPDEIVNGFSILHR